MTSSSVRPSDSPVAVCDNLQAASDRREQWIVENRMKIQPDKVCWMFVSLNHLDREQFSLSCEGKRVRHETEVTYLGEVIDCRVTMVKQLGGNITQAKLALQLVRYAAGQNIQLTSLIKLVRATVP